MIAESMAPALGGERAPLTKAGKVMWTQAMVEDLRRLYPDRAVQVPFIIAHMAAAHGANVSLHAIRIKAGYLGLERGKKRPFRWSRHPGAEDYAIDLVKAGHSDRVAARMVADRFGIKVTNYQVRQARTRAGMPYFTACRWTERAEAILLRNLGRVPADEIARRINRATRIGVTMTGVRNKVHRLGLTAKHEPGDPHLAEAARQLNVGAGTLGNWCDARGYELYGNKYRFIPPAVLTQLRLDFPPITEPMMTVSQAASVLFLDDGWIRKLVTQEKLTGLRRGDRILITVASVDAYRKERGILKPLPQTFGKRVAS